MKDNKESNNQIANLPIFLCIGMSVGMAIGAGIGNISMGMCIGMGMGSAIGLLIDSQNKRKECNDDKKEEQ